MAIVSISQRLAALLVGAAFSRTLTMAQQPTPRPATPPPFEQVYKMPVVYSVPREDQVQVRRDIVYKTVEGPAGNLELKLDMYTPCEAKPADRFPAVVLISGGGAGDHDWRDSGVYISYGKILGASGYTAVTFSNATSEPWTTR